MDRIDTEKLEEELILGVCRDVQPKLPLDVRSGIILIVIKLRDYVFLVGKRLYLKRA